MSLEGKLQHILGSRWTKLSACGLALAILTGCPKENEHIEWVARQGVRPVVTRVPRSQWAEAIQQVEKTYNIRLIDKETLINKTVGFYFPYTTRDGTLMHIIYLQEGFERCLNHEFSHVREFLEGKKYHTYLGPSECG